MRESLKEGKRTENKVPKCSMSNWKKLSPKIADFKISNKEYFVILIRKFNTRLDIFMLSSVMLEKSIYKKYIGLLQFHEIWLLCDFEDKVIEW